MIADWFAPKGLGRRLVTRAMLIFGAVWVSGRVARSLPHEQVLIFPLGSAFPRARHFAAEWKRPGESEALGGVNVSFADKPPLQLRQHTSLADGLYVVSIEVTEKPELNANSDGLQTNLERRVTLSGGETKVALTAGGF